MTSVAYADEKPGAATPGFFRLWRRLRVHPLLLRNPRGHAVLVPRRTGRGLAISGRAIIGRSIPGFLARKSDVIPSCTSFRLQAANAGSQHHVSCGIM